MNQDFLHDLFLAMFMNHCYYRDYFSYNWALHSVIICSNRVPGLLSSCIGTLATPQQAQFPRYTAAIRSHIYYSRPKLISNEFTVVFRRELQCRCSWDDWISMKDLHIVMHVCYNASFIHMTFVGNCRECKLADIKGTPSFWYFLVTPWTGLLGSVIGGYTRARARTRAGKNMLLHVHPHLS